MAASIHRFVVLHHTGAGAAHHDLMVEREPGGPLLTWQLASWPPGPGDVPIQIPEHRREYLSYQGEVSRGRGRVVRVAEGTARLQGGWVVLADETSGASLRVQVQSTPMDISLQLYTVRDKTQKDMPAALREVAAIGYRWVELAGFGSCKGATELRKALDDAGLRVSGMHVGPDVLGKDADKALDEAMVVGSAHVICPWVPVEQRTDADAWKRLAAMLNAVGLKSQKREIQLSYHNHDFEFVRLGEKMAYDLLLETADSACLKMELDVYWVKKAGLDPVGMIKSLGSRLSILHLKDMEPSPEGRFAPVGEGILDFPSILAEGRRLNVAFGCVEMDSTYGRPTMECAKAAFDNLKRLGA